MKRLLLPLLAALALPTAVNAETIYLLIFYRESFAVIPMESKKKCEEAGLLYLSSDRLMHPREPRKFECFVGK